MTCSIYSSLGGMLNMWAMSFWGMGGMWLGLVVLAVIAYWIYSSTYRSRTYRRSWSDPLTVARMRLARGDITAEEFEAIKKKLTT